MAVTKIWAVKHNLLQLVNYVCNPEKVTEKASEETLKVLVEYGAADIDVGEMTDDEFRAFIKNS